MDMEILHKKSYKYNMAYIKILMGYYSKLELEKLISKFIWKIIQATIPKTIVK